MSDDVIKIFLSHASRDSEIVTYFMDDILIGVLGFKHTEIFYTSGDGTKIKSGHEWRNSIKDNLLGSDIVILIITPNYKESEICLNEMGAAWVSAKNVLPVIISPITYEKVGVTMDVSQVEKLTDEKGLDRIRDQIEEIFGKQCFKIRSDRWTKKKKDFLEKVDKYIKEHPFIKPIDIEEYEEIVDKNITLSLENVSLKNENNELKRLSDELSKNKYILKKNNQGSNKFSRRVTVEIMNLIKSYTHSSLDSFCIKYDLMKIAPHDGTNVETRVNNITQYLLNNPDQQIEDEENLTFSIVKEIIEEQIKWNNFDEYEKTFRKSKDLYSYLQKEGYTIEDNELKVIKS